jgi:hypothetical protein
MYHVAPTGMSCKLTLYRFLNDMLIVVHFGAAR